MRQLLWHHVAFVIFARSPSEIPFRVNSLAGIPPKIRNPIFPGGSHFHPNLKSQTSGGSNFHHYLHISFFGGTKTADLII